MNKINKQTIKFEKPLLHLACNIKRVQANQLRSVPPLNHQKFHDFLMIPGGTEVK